MSAGCDFVVHSLIAFDYQSRIYTEQCSRSLQRQNHESEDNTLRYNGNGVCVNHRSVQRNGIGQSQCFGAGVVVPVKTSIGNMAEAQAQPMLVVDSG